MANWNDIGKRALNICLNTYRKSEDYEEALESFDEELVDNMEETGIEFEDGWEFDLSISQISDLISGINKNSTQFLKRSNLFSLISIFSNSNLILCK